MPERPPPLRETLRLPGRGRLEVRVDERRLVFRSDGGRAHAFDAHPIFAEPGRFAHVAACDGRSLLIARHESDRLHLFDVERMVFRPVPGFERLRRAEELSLHALGGGYLVITENGVARVDASGRVRWRLDEVTHGWRLLAEADGAVWMRDAAGNVLAYAVETGHEIAG